MYQLLEKSISFDTVLSYVAWNVKEVFDFIEKIF